MIVACLCPVHLVFLDSLVYEVHKALQAMARTDVMVREDSLVCLDLLAIQDHKELWVILVIVILRLATRLQL